MKTMIMRALQRRAKKVMTRFHPTVVAVTGSVGKTSTKAAIALALDAKFVLRTPEKNFNNEFGLPLTILGETKSPGKNVLGWLGVFLRSRKIATYPQMLVLEYGADRSGDIAMLCRIATPNVSVITGISPVHLANYASLDALIAEKASLGEHTDPNGLVVLNADDPQVLAMRARMQAPVVTYGLQGGDVTAADMRLETFHDKTYEPGEVYAVTTATVRAGGDEAQLRLTNCVGAAPVSSCLAAIAVARHFGIALQDVVEQLNRKMRPVPGRLQPIAGIRGSLVLDDTYNAAPASVRAGLDALALFVPGETADRRIAVLGKMAELGEMSREEHRAIGRRVAEVAQLFVAVGAEMRDAAEAAIAAGMPREAVEWFGTPVEAGRYLDNAVRAGDVVLVKGSQSARMEKAVKDIMAEPLRAEELLVRQDPYWLRQ